MTLINLLKPYYSEIILGATGLFALLIAYFRGREGGAAKGAKMVADTAKKALEAELKAREVFDVKKQNVLDVTAKNKAILDSINIPDSWPDSGIIQLSKKGRDPKISAIRKLSDKRK